MTSDELAAWARKVSERAMEPSGLGHPQRIQRIKETLAEFAVACQAEADKEEPPKKKGMFK